jgi:hypothetical protein
MLLSNFAAMSNEGEPHNFDIQQMLHCLQDTLY